MLVVGQQARDGNAAAVIGVAHPALPLTQQHRFCEGPHDTLPLIAVRAAPGFRPVYRSAYDGCVLEIDPGMIAQAGKLRDRLVLFPLFEGDVLCRSCRRVCWRL